MAINFIELELSQREAQLILEYGYPFEHEKNALKAISSLPGYHQIKFEVGTAHGLIADLVYSAKKISDSSILEEFDAICDVLDRAELAINNN
ncbi:MAG: hypothetical protein ACJA13_003503 [Paraglaciecola sp.]